MVLCIFSVREVLEEHDGTFSVPLKSPPKEPTPKETEARDYPPLNLYSIPYTVPFTACLPVRSGDHRTLCSVLSGPHRHGGDMGFGIKFASVCIPYLQFNICDPDILLCLSFLKYKIG